MADTFSFENKRLRYPKFILLALTFVIAYLILEISDLTELRNFVASLGYFGAFISGIMYSYSFTAAPATAILLILAANKNIILTGIVAGIGALLADIIIFRFIRHSFADEIERLSKESFFKKIAQRLPRAVDKYIVPVIAGIIIASPLPDEIGVSMLASCRIISVRIFMLLSYVLNTAGIFVVLIIGSNL
jgi:uncharacterized membrane protein YdjX (TVP38/TMEM64 family)